MKLIKNSFFIVFTFGLCPLAHAQSLDSLLGNIEKDKKEYVYATFKSTKIINGHSIESPSKGVLLLMFSHRFGAMNEGVYDWFGFDAARMRLGLDYGVTNWLSVGVGRSTIQKAYDGNIKLKLLRQSMGYHAMPVSVVLAGTAAINTLKLNNPGFDYKFSHRLYYTGQLLIARKFSSSLSLQLMPTVVHRNLTDRIDEKNTIFAIGAGGRLKLTKRLSLTAEYYYNLPNQLGPNYHNPVAIGIDIETGGHVFQLHFTNAQGMTEHQFIGMTDFDVTKGFKAIRMGFNFSRVFTIVRYDEVKSTW